MGRCSCRANDGRLDLVGEVHEASVEHPDEGSDDFMTKLKGRLANASAPASAINRRIDMGAATFFLPTCGPNQSVSQVREIWAWSGEPLSYHHPLLTDDVLQGIGSGGQAFNTLRYLELAFLIEVLRQLKRLDTFRRRQLLTDYDAFVAWIATVPQRGHRQYRQMLRFFAFPDRVERMSSNNDRIRMFEGFGVATGRDLKQWSDSQLDDGLSQLRAKAGEGVSVAGLGLLRGTSSRTMVA